MLKLCLQTISFPISEKLAVNYACSEKYFEGLCTCFDDLHNHKVCSPERGSKFPLYNSMSVRKFFLYKKRGRAGC